MPRLSKLALSLALLLAGTQANAIGTLPGHLLLEAGGYRSYQGESQFVNIQGLIGDRFSTTSRNDNNAILGAGYILDGFKRDKYSIDYGINAYYLAKTQVEGRVTQEKLFTNLGYRYNVSHFPIYAIAKADVKTHINNLDVTFDAGVGPNFMTVSQFHEWSLDGGVTLPDHIFQSHSNVNFSAMAGIGLKMQMTKQVALELGYRLFYLGSGYLDRANNQVQDHLATGNDYAQALIFSICA